MSAHVLGVDPGHDGAAVLVGDAVRVWRWHDRRKRKTEPGYDLAVGGVELLRGASMARVGYEVGAAAAGADLVVEGLFAGRNSTAALDLAETTGRLLAGLEGAGLRPSLRPPWIEWARAVVTGRLDTAALQGARPGWLAAHGLSGLGDDDHVLDAACLAVYGRRLRGGRAPPALADRRPDQLRPGRHSVRTADPRGAEPRTDEGPGA